MIRNKSMKRVSLVSAVIATGAMVLSTLPAQAATPGVTASEIKLGISSPLTGSAGLSYGKVPGAMKAYFNYINANGGVYGRKITLISRDDKYLPTLANQFPILGAEEGIVFDVGLPPARFGEDFSQYKWFFWISALATLVMVWFIANLLSTKYGRTFRALRDNPIAAELSGINVGRLKVTAFAISSGVAGLSGGLLVMLISGVSPSAFPLSLSFALLGGAVVTGLYNLKGVILGGLVLVAIPEIADSLVSRIGGSEGFITILPGFLVSALLILAVVFTPNGPGHLIKRHHKK